MDLAQEAPEVVDLVECLHGEHHLARRRRDVAEIGEVGLETLHLYLGVGGAAPGLGDEVGVGVDGDGLGPGTGERDRVVPA